MILIVYFIILAGYFNIVIALFGAFFFGIIENLWNGETLGTASFTYIVIVYSVHLYKRKFNAKSPAFMLLAGMVSIFIIEMIQSKSFAISTPFILKAFEVSVLTVLIWVLLYKLWERKYGERKLSV
jgi:cell shape-determining protein MreD